MSKMKTEEDKYVYQQQQTLLDMKTKNGHVYNETTVKSQQTTGKKTSCMSSHLFSRLQIILASLAIVTCLIVIAVSDHRFRLISILVALFRQLGAFNMLVVPTHCRRMTIKSID